MSNTISSGTAHTVPDDLKKALSSDGAAQEKWNSLTPLARNEWICWTMSVKQAHKRAEHVARVTSELKEGKRRPCCWYGCMHRKDKPLSPTQKFLLEKQQRTKKGQKKTP